MPLKVQACTPADFPRFVQVEREAWKDDEFSPILFPGPFSENAEESRLKEITKETEQDSSTRWFKVVDTDINAEIGSQAIAFAKWNVYSDRPPPIETTRDFGPHCNVEVCRLNFGGLDEQRMRILGDKRCVYLHILVTDPDHERRGAGGMLIDWGVEEAKKQGIPAYVESSVKGQALYKKHGFKVLEQRDVGLSRWGVSKPHSSWAMIRD